MMSDAVEIPMPDVEVGADVEITLVAWLKQPGERVAAGEIIAEVLCEKANVEIESPVGGLLEAILVTEGEVVTVGQPLARVTVG
jgi:pyruvate/2-oxoglutarate dehydrogenase complex dihydrolipoamide acyltransferase (E2) component